MGFDWGSIGAVSCVPRSCAGMPWIVTSFAGVESGVVAEAEEVAQELTAEYSGETDIVGTLLALDPGGFICCTFRGKIEGL